MAFIVDASVSAAWCFPDERTDYTNAVLTAIPRSGAFVPRLWAYEIRNSVLMGIRRGRIGKAHAEDFFASLRALPIQFTEPASYDDVFRLADRHSLTVYDAAYLDVALREKLPLATLDGALIRAAQTMGIGVFQP
jgi:predicted nucleic acid-binding protein